MIVIFEQVLLLFLFCVTGFGLCKGKLCKPEHAKTISALEVYVFLPCVVFRNFSANVTVDYLKEKYPLLLVSVGLLVVTILLSGLAARGLTKNKFTQAVYRYTLTVPNFSYIGFALCEALYGSKVLLDVMMFTLPMSLYSSSFGYCMLTTPGGGKIQPKRLLAPSTIAAFFGLRRGPFRPCSARRSVSGGGEGGSLHGACEYASHRYHHRGIQAAGVDRE